MAGDQKNSFWTTLPGILTGIAAIITALGAIGVVIRQNSTGPVSSDQFYIEEVKRFDPSPDDGDIVYQDNITLYQCKKLCLNDSSCKSLYWVPTNDGACWTKSLVQNSKYKNFEEGVGGIKRQR